ncbi:MAG: DNA primase [Hyphomicrobiales bacterium]|nr:DNA primase [Hyphomicrobiales bacterium]
MRFSPQFLDEIRARVPISDVVGRAVTWDRRKSTPAKGDYWACCPFHSEKTPSFHADNRRGIYHCFGCQASGDIFRFLIEKEGLSFPETVERLAAEAGLDLPKPDARAGEREDARKNLYEVVELAAKFFEEKLQAREGAHARGYLSDRGLEPKTLTRFRIGHAPSGRYALKEHLGAKGVPVEAMIAAGLLVSGEDIPVPFDRFRDRVMFPILDARGRAVGFGARALSPDAQAKYLNSPETDLFHKGALLYNLAQARAGAHKAGAIVAVEGYMDVIALAQAGIENVVAPLGTALTPEQIALLWRLADEPVLCFDGDAPGLKAAYRAADTALALLSPGKSLAFALMPDGQDPDDVVGSQGRGGFEALVAVALPLIDMIWQRETEAADFSTPERRAAFERRLREIVRMIGDDSVRRHYGEAIAGRLAALWQPRPAGTRGAPRPANARGRPNLGPSRALRASPLLRGGAQPLVPREALLVATIVNHPELLEEEAETFARLDLSSPELDRLRREILDIAAHEAVADAAALDAQLRRAGFAALIDRLGEIARRGRHFFAAAHASAGDTLTGWRHTAALHRKSSTLHKELRAAERALAEEGSEESLVRLKDIQAQIEGLEGREALIEGFGE